MSPQAGFDTSTVMAGTASSPTLRGFRKCSSRRWLYTPISTFYHLIVNLLSVQVVAGVIERDGLLLICQRKAGDRYALKWEFPGGKVEPGEDPRTALGRELEEELALEASIGEEILRYTYQYPARAPVLLIFYRVTEYRGEPSNRQFEQIRWEPRQRLLEYDFLDGDGEFVRRLVRGDV